MSGYMPAQALLKDLLLDIRDYFGADDVTEGDYGPMDSSALNCAVLVPGSVPAFDLAGMTREHAYETLLDLFTKFTDDDSYNTFGELRDAVIAQLDANPALSETYFMTSITADGDPMDVYDKMDAGPFFVTQRFRITIQEQV